MVYIKGEKIDEKSIDYVTRVHYKAENVPNDSVFGEHEIDYVLFLQGDFELCPNLNEVKEVRYVTENELKEFIKEASKKDSPILLTPWFMLICDKFLFDWWKSLENVNAIKDEKNIHRFV